MTRQLTSIKLHTKDLPLKQKYYSLSRIGFLQNYRDKYNIEISSLENILNFICVFISFLIWFYNKWSVRAWEYTTKVCNTEFNFDRTSLNISTDLALGSIPTGKIQRRQSESYVIKRQSIL